MTFASLSLNGKSESLKNVCSVLSLTLRPPEEEEEEEEEWTEFYEEVHHTTVITETKTEAASAFHMQQHAAAQQTVSAEWCLRNPCPYLRPTLGPRDER